MESIEQLHLLHDIYYIHTLKLPHTAADTVVSNQALKNYRRAAAGERCSWENSHLPSGHV